MIDLRKEFEKAHPKPSSDMIWDYGTGRYEWAGGSPRDGWIDSYDAKYRGFISGAQWQSQQPPAELRYTHDGALAECPCCGSLDVGAAGGGCSPNGRGIVNCYSCGLTIQAKGPMQAAIDLWNRRAGRPTKPKPVTCQCCRNCSEKPCPGSLYEGECERMPCSCQRDEVTVENHADSIFD